MSAQNIGKRRKDWSSRNDSELCSHFHWWKDGTKEKPFQDEAFLFCFCFFGVSFIFLVSLTGLHGRESMSSAFITNLNLSAINLIALLENSLDSQKIALWPSSEFLKDKVYCFGYQKSFIKSASSYPTHPKKSGQGTQNWKKKQILRLRDIENKEAVYLGQKPKLQTQRIGWVSSQVRDAQRFFDPTLMLFLAFWMGEGLFD